MKRLYFARLVLLGLVLTLIASLGGLVTMTSPPLHPTATVAVAGPYSVHDEVPSRASRSRSYVAPTPPMSAKAVHPPHHRVTTTSPHHWVHHYATRRLVVTSHSTGSVWDRLAQCESGGRWSYNGSSGFDGGLQFLPSTWTSKKFSDYPAYAWQATRDQQIAVAVKVQRESGWGQWPACSRKLGLR